MKLSKVKALRICRELWIWLHESGSRSKQDWEGWNRDKYGAMSHFCPCCEYALPIAESKHETTTYACVYLCPLNELAWLDGACLDHNSIFRKWQDEGNYSLRKAYAYDMVKACEEALRKIKKKVEVYNGTRLQ